MATVGSPCGTFRKPCATCQSALFYFRKPCSKSFGEQCALEGLLEGVVSPNAAKSASLVKNVPCRPLCEGYFHQTILNNSHEYTKMHHNRASPPIAFCHHLLLPSSSAQPSPNHSFRLRHHSICRLVLPHCFLMSHINYLLGFSRALADTLDETLPQTWTQRVGYRVITLQLSAIL